MDLMYHKVISFIDSSEFFYYHGLVLALVWYFGSNVAILARKISTVLHGICFFFLDLISVFFIAGAWVRIYPHIGFYSSWSLLKICHIIGGSFFALMLLLQHVGGVNTLLKGIKRNPEHRKFGFLVTNSARFICIFGFLLVDKYQIAKYLAIIAVVLLIVSFYKTFYVTEEKVTERPKKI